MGTSKGYQAPTSGEWPGLKRHVTSVARGLTNHEMSSDDISSMLKHYIRCNGGSRAIVHGHENLANDGSAQAVASSLAAFLISVRETGLCDTICDHEKALRPRAPVAEIIVCLVDLIGGNADTLNRVDARNALSRLLIHLLRDANNPAEAEEVLSASADEAELQAILIRFFAYYIYEQFCRVFYERLAARIGVDEADQALVHILEYIHSVIRHLSLDVELADVNWNGKRGCQIAEQILLNTLEVFGDDPNGV